MIYELDYCIILDPDVSPIEGPAHAHIHPVYSIYLVTGWHINKEKETKRNTLIALLSGPI